MFKDETGEIVPAIVDEALWDRANEILRRRSEDVKSRQGICNHANLLTGKLYCTCCGVPYYRRESQDKKGNKNSKWICSGKIKNGADSCPSFPIYEEEIRPVLFSVFEDTQSSAEAMIEEYIRMYNEQTDNGTLPQKIAAQQKIIDFANQKLQKLLQYNIAGQITDDEYLSQAKLCRKEIADAEEEIRELDSLAESTDEFKKHIEAIRTTLRKAQADAAQGLITKQFVDTYIDKIFVTPVDEETMKLDVRIFTGESSERFFKKLVFRSQLKPAVSVPECENPAISTVSGSAVSAGQTIGELTADMENPELSTVSASENSTGQTFKKMIEAYENGMK